MKVWESDGKLSLLELLKADPEVTARVPPDRARKAVRPRLPFEARGHDLRPGVRPFGLTRPTGQLAGADGDLSVMMGPRDRMADQVSSVEEMHADSIAEPQAGDDATSSRAAICSSCRWTGWCFALRRTSIACSSKSHVTLIGEPLGEFVHAQALHDLRNLISRLSGTTGIARAYRVRLTDETGLVDIAFQVSDGRVILEAMPQPGPWLRRSVRDHRGADSRAKQRQRPGVARRRGSAHARADWLRPGDVGSRRQTRREQPRKLRRTMRFLARLPGDLRRWRGRAGRDFPAPAGRNVGRCRR